MELILQIKSVQKKKIVQKTKIKKVVPLEDISFFFLFAQWRFNGLVFRINPLISKSSFFVLLVTFIGLIYKLVQRLMWKCIKYICLKCSSQK